MTGKLRRGSGFWMLFLRTGLLSDFRVRFAGSFRTVGINSPERDGFSRYTPRITSTAWHLPPVFCSRWVPPVIGPRCRCR